MHFCPFDSPTVVFVVRKADVCSRICALLNNNPTEVGLWIVRKVVNRYCRHFGEKSLSDVNDVFVRKLVRKLVLNHFEASFEHVSSTAQTPSGSN